MKSLDTDAGPWIGWAVRPENDLLVAAGRLPGRLRIGVLRGSDEQAQPERHS
jgi:hypothetical protein